LFGRKAEVFGHFIVINPKNITIGRNCHINEGVFMHGEGRIIIGDDVALSARCMLLDTSYELDTFAEVRPRPHVNKTIIIEDGAWIGARAVVLPGVTVGKMAIVGAGSIVTRDVPPYTIVAGNPAREIGMVTKQSKAA
jgi:maltose O-acetyltransferase